MAPSEAMALLMYDLKPTWKSTTMKSTGITVQVISRIVTLTGGERMSPFFRLYLATK